MRAPLAVWLDDGRTRRMVTKQVRGLRFSKTAPGGFARASMQLLLPRNTFTDLGAADKAYISDGRNGQTVWEGFTENPGTQDGPSGQGFDLSCLGTTILASDESRALVYIDRKFDQWQQYRGASSAAAPSASAGQSDDPAGASADPGLLIQLTPGQPVTTNSFVQIGYEGFRTAAGMEFGAIQTRGKSGKADTGYRVRMAYSAPGSPSGAFEIYSTTTTLTTEVFDTRYVTDASSVPAGQNAVALLLQRTGGATNIADDTTWSWFHDVAVLGRRMNRFGTLLSSSTGMVTTSYVLASWVVEDLLGRLLTFADKGLSRVDTSTWQIDQLAYLDGVKAANLLDDLSLWEPDFLWEILQSTPSGYIFNYRAWPTTVRYEISAEDGFTQPGADVDLCNRIAVSWTDERGNQKLTIRGRSVPALGNGSPVLADGTRDPAYTGRVRDADTITLPDGQGSLANAQRIGDQELAARANPPKAGTAVVRRPIMDRLTGNTAYPWELEPGYLVRVRETGDVLRLTEMEYVDDDCAATLTLGEPVLTNEQRLARLSRKVG